MKTFYKKIRRTSADICNGKHLPAFHIENVFYVEYIHTYIHTYNFRTCLKRQIEHIRENECLVECVKMYIFKRLFGLEEVIT